VEQLPLAPYFPGQWVKPIVNLGVLPAHAQTSGFSPGNDSFAAGSQSFTVPSGASSITFEVAGASGNARIENTIKAGGGGGITQATFAVGGTLQAGQTLEIVVGTQGLVPTGGNTGGGGGSAFLHADATGISGTVGGNADSDGYVNVSWS
jgi:hypothetical protein